MGYNPMGALILPETLRVSNPHSGALWDRPLSNRCCVNIETTHLRGRVFSSSKSLLGKLWSFDAFYHSPEIGRIKDVSRKMCLTQGIRET